MKKFKVSFGYVVLILVLSVSLFGFLQYVLKGSTRSSQSYSPTPLPKNPETGWNIYREEETGFIFEFPSKFELTKAGLENDGHVNLRLLDPDGGYGKSYNLEGFNEYFSVTIDIYPKSKDNFETKVIEPICAAQNQIDSSKIPACKRKLVNLFDPFMSGSIEGKMATINPFEQVADFYFFEFENYDVVVTQTGPEGIDPGEDQREILKEIISTFRFLRR